ncbi:hypothetical protein FE257_005595 [Aspergillus nanangensis]|uniref:Cytochrome P450 n=1 Tax=Aspergillus nanangensis TaxID=2582783 RepID=A0AAD4GUK6_ASPNN|nr:hypothetical protein FE257_005595 [Aspergillus nanangensis]
MVRYYSFFSVEMILVVGPEAIAELCLQRCDSFSHSKTIEFLAEAGMGYAGMLGTRGETHKHLRRLFSPVFTPGTMAEICAPLWQSCLTMTQALPHDTASVQLGQWTSRSILELSGTYVLGQKPGWLTQYPELLASLQRRVATGQIKTMVLSIFPRSIRSLLMLTLFGHRELTDLRYLEHVARDMLQAEKRKLMISPGKTPHSLPNVISVMLEDGTFSEQQILGDILVFLIGASETTSATFQWMILELCRHPEVQVRLREELHLRRSASTGSEGTGTGTGDETLFARQIESFPYLRAVVDEVLRLHPAVVLTEHEATEDTTIAGVLIPRGTLLLCPPLAANVNPRVWGEDAAVFNPDRWLDRRRVASSHLCANMTFSHGPRSCPGRSVARLMLTCLTAAFVSQYQVSLEDSGKSYVPIEAVYAKPTPELVVRLARVI